MLLKLKNFILFLALSFVLTNCKLLIITPPPLLTLPLKNYKVSQQFATIWNPSHQGIDLRAPRGTPVYSGHSGKVIYAGQRLSGYGKTVIIEYSEYWATLYAHLNEIKTQQGLIISAGNLIGTVGRTGRATGDHLHFELLYKKQPINPLPYLKK